MAGARVVAGAGASAGSKAGAETGVMEVEAAAGAGAVGRGGSEEAGSAWVGEAAGKGEEAVSIGRGIPFSCRIGSTSLCFAPMWKASLSVDWKMSWQELQLLVELRNDGQEVLSLVTRTALACLE